MSQAYQAYTSIRALLKERLACAQAEVALLERLIDFVDKPGSPTNKSKWETSKDKAESKKKGKCRKRCSICKEESWVATATRHCPACKARSSLKVHHI